MTTIQKAQRAVRYVILAALALSPAPVLAQTYTLAPPPFQYVLNTAGGIVPQGCVWTYQAGTTTAIATYADASGTPNGNPIIADNYGRFTAYLLPGTAYKFQYENTPCSAPSTHGAILKVQDNIYGTPSAAANVDITGTLGESVTAAQCVYLSDGSGGKNNGQWYKCDSANTYSSTTPDLGFAVNAITLGTQGTIRRSGYVAGLSSLSAGLTYYVGTSGGVTATPPANARKVGQADTTTTLIVGDPPPQFILQPFTNNFRISLTSATCVTSSDVTGGSAVTLYLTPCTGNRITLFSSAGAVETCSTAEVSIAVPATTSQMYDIWAYDSSFGTCTVTLELLAWTNDTTRATALARNNGVWTKSGDSSRLYVGSFRTAGVSGQTEDSVTKRYVWNMYNRARRTIARGYADANWNYTTAAWRQANGNTANQVEVVVGLAESVLFLRLEAAVSNSSGGTGGNVAFGEDVTNSPASIVVGGTLSYSAGAIMPLSCTFEKMPAIGRHFYALLEFSAASGTTTWYGSTAPSGTSSSFGAAGTWES